MNPMIDGLERLVEVVRKRRPLLDVTSVVVNVWLARLVLRDDWRVTGAIEWLLRLAWDGRLAWLTGLRTWLQADQRLYLLSILAFWAGRSFHLSARREHNPSDRAPSTAAACVWLAFLLAVEGLGPGRAAGAALVGIAFVAIAGVYNTMQQSHWAHERQAWSWTSILVALEINVKDLGEIVLAMWRYFLAPMWSYEIPGRHLAQGLPRGAVPLEGSDRPQSQGKPLRPPKRWYGRSN